MFRRKSGGGGGNSSYAASSIPKTRISKELEELSESDDTGVSATPLPGTEDMHWKATIQGPDDTAYHGGTFNIEIKLPSQYPFAPPKMKFTTRVWHPNISSQTGAICLDILKDEWSPALTIRTALQSLQALLSAPEPDDPQDAVVANMYKDDRPLFEQTAKNWTQMYATEGGVDPEAVAAIVEMGFGEDAVKEALKACDHDRERALNMLLGA